MSASCWPMLSRKIRKMVKRRIFWWSAAYLAAMLAHLEAMLAYLEGNVGSSWGYVGPSWGYVGPSWGYVSPSWSYVGLSWGYVGPSWGLCWPILRLCWSILRPMLAHVDPSWATKAEKLEKMGRAQNAVKRGGFWRHAVYGGWGGGPSFLRRGENCRTARTRPGGPWPDLSAYARQPARGPTMLAHLVAMLAYAGLMLTQVEPKEPKSANSKKTL